MPVTELAFIPLPPSSSSDQGNNNSPTTIPPPLQPLLRDALKIQDKWCDETPSASRGAGFFISIHDPSAAADLDQPPTPTILCTAHWDSQSHHHEWIASQENLSAFKPMFPHIDVPRILFFHVRDAELFPSSSSSSSSSKGEEGGIYPKAPLSAPYVSVSRFLIRVKKEEEGEGQEGTTTTNTTAKSTFEEKVSSSSSSLMATANAAATASPRRRGGWRIEDVKRKELTVSSDGEGGEEEGEAEADGIEEYDLVGGWDYGGGEPEDAGTAAAAAVWERVRAEDEELAKLAVRCERWVFRRVC